MNTNPTNGETPKTENEIEAAKAKIEDIRQKILGGDTSLTASDLASARGELEFAELRESARIEREEKRARSEHRDELLSIKNEASELADVSRFEKLLPKIEKSIDDFLAQAKDRNDKIAAIGEKLAEKGYLPGYIHSSPVEDIEITAASVVNPLTIGDVTAKPIDARREIEKIVSEALSKYPEFRGR